MTTTEDPDVRPVDYEPPRRANGTSGGELIAAIQKALANPDRWVNVGGPRKLGKPPHNWVSEVRLGQKTALDGQRWDASFEVTGGQDERHPKLYQKMIKLLVSGTSESGHAATT